MKLKQHIRLRKRRTWKEIGALSDPHTREGSTGRRASLITNETALCMVREQLKPA